MNKIYYIQSLKFKDFLNSFKKTHSVFSVGIAPTNFTKETDYVYKNLNSEGEIDFVYNPYRAVEPLKTFFTHPLDEASEYFDERPIQVDTPTIIFGVKSCDLYAHKIQDFVFLEGVATDSLYKLRRENTIIISSDCTDFKQVCHCLAWDVLPHPAEGFDLNLTPLNDGYLVETGSMEGEILIGQYKNSEDFLPAKDIQINARKTKRDNLIARLKEHLAPQHLVNKNIVQRLMRDGYELDTWKEFMLTCVECGGCNFICDTCHCFLLADKQSGQQNVKLKLWDACQYANYARVAGGANPLKRRSGRLRFRFTKKFDFFVDNLGVPACCGCGRCIEVCPGKIDIREVLKDLAKKCKV